MDAPNERSIYGCGERPVEITTVCGHEAPKSLKVIVIQPKKSRKRSVMRRPLPPSDGRVVRKGDPFS
jgi:hypothetical protein